MELAGLDPERIDALLLKFAGTGPRYTSYPTAPVWSGAYGAGDFGEDLARLEPAVPVSLYVHVPFCRSLCHFCACNRMITRVIQSILCHEAVEAPAFRARFGVSFVERFAAELARLEPFEADGLVARGVGGSLRVLSLGRLVLRNIAMVFDAYLPGQQAAATPLFSQTV